MSRVLGGLLGLSAGLWLAAATAEPIAPDKVPTPPERPAALTPPPAETVPVPPQRPPELSPAPAAAPAPAAEAAKPAEGAIPVPPPKPPERPADLSGEAALALKVSPPDDEACRARLKRLGATFEPLGPIAEGQCTAPLPLKVTALADGIALRPAATLTCRAAEGLARWATEVQVEAQRAFAKPLTGLDLGGTYVCRGQNHDADAKLSDHAFAAAIDVMAFSVAGRAPIPVRGGAGDPAEASFLQASRTKACAFFRTVLGPGSNAAHSNHLHLDERERNAGHRLCE
jgi:hypothetical protein